METIHTGWLVKSPPERPWKLLRPKWRKRYFVLCVSQASTTLPGQCPASLDYYDNEKQSHKRGSIDLNNCDEVLTKLESPQYEHVFSLRTKHKDHHRTYFLATETEDDMNRWVQCLCTVLQLDDAETNNDASLSVDNAEEEGAVIDERYVRVPSNPATPPVPLSSSTTIASFSTLPVLTLDELNGPSTLTDEDKGEAYILLDQCYSGAAAGATSSNSQRPMIRGMDGHSPSTSSLNQPSNANHMKPVKTDNARTDHHKKTDYCNLSKNGGGAGAKDKDTSKRKRASSQPNTAAVASATAMIYDFPSTVVDPKSSSRVAVTSSSRAFASLESHRTVEVGVTKTSSPAAGVRSSPNARLVSSSQSPNSLSDKDYDFPSYINLNSLNSSSSSSYDNSIHRYMNAASMPLSGQSPCSSPKSVTSANGSSAHPAVGHGVSNSPTTAVKNGSGRGATAAATHLASTDGAGVAMNMTDMEPAVMTVRTQSFKRSIVHTEVPLPIKKCGHANDTSSSEDDASDEDSPASRSYEDRTSQEELPPVPLPPKKRSLDAAVQSKDAIQYLDLNLEESSKGERSPSMSSRSIQHLASSETNYNEIDWVKTKALLETKKDLESERHNSERSSD